MDLPFELADGVELALDVTPASWIDERLLPIDRAAGVRVGEVIPTGFEAYARVFHPVRAEPGMRRLRWSDIAERHDTRVHPEMQLEHIVGNLEIRDVPGLESPEEGSLPREEVETLIDLLRPFTHGDACWLAIWDGFGSLGPGLAIMRHLGADRAAARAHERAERERRRRAATQLAAIPRFSIQKTPGASALRDYILLHGRLRDASRLEFNGSFQSPNLWWPEDRSWCVATEVDGFSTYVGGSATCIDSVLADPRLEALPSSPSNRFDLWSDRINPPPPGLPERWRD